jgi:hypothetical protein
MLPGEIVVESTGDLPEGEWRLQGHPMPAPPVVLDSVAAGEHRLTFRGRDSLSWNANVRLEPGGIAHVVVPELVPAPAASPEADATAAPVPAPVAPADSTQHP